MTRLPSLRALAAAVLVASSAASLGYAQNSQAAIPLESSAYASIEAIFLEQGLAVPNRARPWTVEELRFELERVAPERLSRAGAAAYALLMETASIRETKAAVQGSIGLSLSPEAFAHAHLSGDASYTSEAYTWAHGYEERKAFIEMPLALWLGDSFYATLGIAGKEEHDTVNSTTNAAGVFPSGVTDNYFNVIFDDPYPRIDLYFPFTVYSSLGGPGWSLRFGRDQLSWGNGHSGNMLLSDYSDYYDFAGLSFFGEYFKFSSVYTVFDSVDPRTLADTVYSALIAHRLDLRLFQKVLVSINESVAFGNAEPELLRDLNYLMIFHNWTIPDRTNSLLSLEINYTPWRYAQVYGQIAMDEFMTSYEAERGGNGGPPVFGYILGASGSYPLGSGYLSAGAEWAMTSPWLYNRQSYPYYYNVHKYYSLTTDGWEYIIKPIGYEYGPDSIVWNAYASYDIPGGVRAGLEFLHWTQGETTIADPWNPQEGDSTPYGDNPLRSWSLSLSGSYPVLSWLEAGGGVAYIAKRNIDHVAGSYSGDMEFSFYVSATF